MPMDPVIGTIISSLLGFAGGALNGPSTQFRKSFDDTGETNPVTLLGEAESGLKNTANALGKKLKGGVQLRGVAPAVPGLGISDPALGNPDLLKYAGLDLPDNLFSGGGGIAAGASPRGAAQVFQDANPGSHTPPNDDNVLPGDGANADISEFIQDPAGYIARHRRAPGGSDAGQ